MPAAGVNDAAWLGHPVEAQPLTVTGRNGVEHRGEDDALCDVQLAESSPPAPDGGSERQFHDDAGIASASPAHGPSREPEHFLIPNRATFWPKLVSKASAVRIDRREALRVDEPFVDGLLIRQPPLGAAIEPVKRCVNHGGSRLVLG
jgi:hypothetical protein